MPALGVNIDHVATLRQARGGIEPEPVLAAIICETAGADSIVAHLREDRRHIQDRDILHLRKLVRTKLNLEMSIAKDILTFACKVKPNQATLVPEKRKELTTEGGLDVLKGFVNIKAAVAKLQAQEIAVSLFIDPVKKQIDASKKTGAKIIELHTGAYADSKDKNEETKLLKQIEDAVKYAKKIGLIVNAGHGLNYSNVTRIARIEGITELNIGHSIISRAVFTGLDLAIKQMKALI